MVFFRLLPSLPLLLLLSACAGPITAMPQASGPEIAREAALQRQLVYQRYVQDQNKLFDIAVTLETYNADFCAQESQGPLLGLTLWNADAVGGQNRAVAAALYGVGERLAVQFVARRSPAAKAGIMAGDIVVAINGEKIPQGKNALKTAAQLLKSAGYRQSDLVLERKGALLTKVATPVRACDYPVILDNNAPEINAYADGKRIIVSKGMMRFAENDDELALVIAHELGHSALSHVDKLRQNAVAGMIGGLAIDGLFAAAGVGTGGQFADIGGDMGAAQHSVAFEQEADYVGMYFMERAGFDASNVANFWRRMAAEGGASISNRTSHPSSPERFLAVERAYQEIKAKKARRQPLIPNLK